MKLKPAIVLIVLAFASIAFISFLLVEFEKEKVCCREKPVIDPKNDTSDGIQENSFKHLIAYNL